MRFLNFQSTDEIDNILNTRGRFCCVVFILLLPIVLQALSKLIPYAVVFEHIIIALALFIGFKIAKSSAADSAQ